MDGSSRKEMLWQNWMPLLILITALGGIASALCYALLVPSPSILRAKQIETLAASQMELGSSPAKLSYSFRNRGPDPVTTIEADYQILKNGEVFHEEKNLIIWTGEMPVAAGEEYQTKGPTSATITYIEGATTVVVHPTRAWATEKEFLSEVQH